MTNKTLTFKPLELLFGTTAIVLALTGHLAAAIIMVVCALWFEVNITVKL